MNWFRWIGFSCFIALAGLAVGSVAVAADQPEPAQASYTVTIADDGKTLPVRVGDSVLLKLGDDLNWTITSDGQPLLRRVPNVLLVRGAQGLYTVERPGEADLSATGTPKCAPDQACPQFLVLFHAHVAAQIAVAGSFKYAVILPQLAADSAVTRSFALTGTALAGPTCPVQRNPPDPACSDRPVSGAEMIVTNEAGAKVADVVTDANGRFTITLPPGNYTLRPQPVLGVLRTAPSQDFQIVNADIQLAVSYDTGIR